MREKVIAYAIQVFGNEKIAFDWLRRENHALGYKKPIDLIHNEKGCDQVITILGRIEDGVYS